VGPGKEEPQIDYADNRDSRIQPEHEDLVGEVVGGMEARESIPLPTAKAMLMGYFDDNEVYLTSSE
jgi:hypothetical protein